MLNHHTLSEDLIAGTALSHFYSHLYPNHKYSIIYKIIEISEGTAIIETYDFSGFRAEPLSNKDFDIQDDGKSIINLECFLKDQKAEFFKLRRPSYRTFT